MKTEYLIEALQADFFTGVPDSLLRPFCDCLMDAYGIDARHHIIAANEGNCVALAAGYHLATGKVPVVYLQNSGEGNIINPVASLLNDNVYAIPMIFVIGWRGEPGVHDEPQHVYQGQVTLKLLEDMDIASFVLGKETTDEELQEVMGKFRVALARGKQAALVIRKGALSYDGKVVYKNEYKMLREDILKHIVAVSGEDPIVSTTGKASRELFEIREAGKESHKYDFLTVGSMGHSSSIALGIAIQKSEQKIWCIDGDGAVLMHMGSMAIMGNVKPQNMVHILINNGAHETVGGMPTAVSRVDFPAMAKACGYDTAEKAETFDELDIGLKKAKKAPGLHFLEAACALGARSDLGRPVTTARENKENFMNHLHGIS